MIAVEPSERPSSLTRQRYRADVDGLRAVAVLAVLGFHGFPRWVPGGFVGVDVFFVISGFLISGLILASLETRRFSFKAFYARRARRIFPALLVVLVTAFVLGWFALLPDEYKQLGKHIAGASAFVSNFVLWSESGYFDNAAATKPLLHLWSLGIEEQFYLLWPLTLVIVWRWRARLLPIVATMALASFAWNVHVVRANTVAAFYSPATRLWELLLGATLACAAVGSHPSDQAQGPAGGLRDAASMAGAAMIVAAAAVLSGATRFPGWWALLPTVGTFLLIAAGERSIVNRAVLARPAVVWVGLISYPVYLWHWMLLSFASIISSDNAVPRDLRLAIVIASVVLAALTYYLVERPIRFRRQGRAVVAALATSLVVVGCIGFVTYRRAGIPSRIAGRAGDPNDRSARLARIELPGTTDCAAVVKLDTSNAYCRTTPAPNVAVIGDSHAGHLYRGFVASGNPFFERAMLIGAGGCWPTLDAETFDGCNRVLRTALDTIAKTPTIKVVVLAGYQRTIEEMPTQADRFFDGYLKTFAALRADGVRVVFAIDPPTLRSDPEVCLRRRPVEQWFPASFLKPAFCAGASREDLKGRADYDRLVARLRQAEPSVFFYDPSPALCADGRCKVFDSGLLLYWDSNHLSVHGSEYLVSDLIARLQ